MEMDVLWYLPCRARCPDKTIHMSGRINNTSTSLLGSGDNKKSSKSSWTGNTHYDHKKCGNHRYSIPTGTEAVRTLTPGMRPSVFEISPFEC